jgi:hypothetical protein
MDIRLYLTYCYSTEVVVEVVLVILGVVAETVAVADMVVAVVAVVVDIAELVVPAVQVEMA